MALDARAFAMGKFEMAEEPGWSATVAHEFECATVVGEQQSD
jgi:hypothetical protein